LSATGQTKWNKPFLFNDGAAIVALTVDSNRLALGLASLAGYLILHA
jgi:hypothetical protein